VAFATLGIDQVSHGPRRGTSPASKTSPNDLFFNFANPAAARFNALQGAADQHTLVRFVEGAGTITVGTDAFKLDGTKIVFWGHSQGATEGALFLAFDASVKGAILSGEGGGLIDSLVTKTSPVNIRDMLYLPLEESGPKAVGAYHPVLGLLQQWIDPADPLHFARLAYAPSLTMGAFHRNVFQPFGTDDTYAPSQTQLAFAFAGFLPLIKPIVDPNLKISAVDSVQGNIVAAGGAGASTAAFRQYAPSGYDGHFVVFKNDQARTDAMKVLARSARGEVPKIPE
jgi:pimeloyl-ACP methyl ester carboxylesterase